jgi:membrane-bound serine protease (ClpP class)
MKLFLLIAILASIAAFAVVIVVALYQHKKASVNDFQLIGETAQVDKELDPEGTVIVCGELWRAKSQDGTFISANASVRVVGFENHLVLVAVSD